MESVKKLKSRAQKARGEVLRISYNSRSGHIGSAFSSIDLLVGLYDGFLRSGTDSRRDRFILGKGHAAAALYHCLHVAGLIDKETLDGFGKDGGTLRHHPDRRPEWGIDFTTGSLGHGLSLAAGLGYGARLNGEDWRAVVLLSDGEMAEGMIWEAAMFAAHHHLDNLLAIVDCNKMQALGKTHEILDAEDLAQKWEAFGWGVQRIDGHDLQTIQATFGAFPFETGKPSVIIADTVKGKGVSFMEDDLLWHYRCPDDDEYEAALKEIGSDEN